MLGWDPTAHSPRSGAAPRRAPAPACVTVPACAAAQRKAKSPDLARSAPTSQAVPGTTCWSSTDTRGPVLHPAAWHSCCANTGVSAIKQTRPQGPFSWKITQGKNKSYSLVRAAHQPCAATQRSVLAGKNGESTQNRQERSCPLSRSSHRLRVCDTRPGPALRWPTANGSATEPRRDPAPQARDHTSPTPVAGTARTTGRTALVMPEGCWSLSKTTSYRGKTGARPFPN